MDLDVAKKLISNYVAGHCDFVTKADVAERYYKVENDILFYKEHCPDELKIHFEVQIIGYHSVFIIY